MLKLRAVGSKMRHLQSLTADESDERERNTYIVNNYVDIKSENLDGGFYIEESTFGFELPLAIGQAVNAV